MRGVVQNNLIFLFAVKKKFWEGIQKKLCGGSNIFFPKKVFLFWKGPQLCFFGQGWVQIFIFFFAVQNFFLRGCKVFFIFFGGGGGPMKGLELIM